MTSLQFWHEHIGQYIGSEAAGNLKPPVLTRLKRGVDLNTLGAGIDAFYIACEGDSHIIGKIELPNKKGLTFTASEDVSGERFIAHWLAHKAPTDKPWIIGVVSKANPSSSVMFSQAPSLCVFCHMGKNFEFNLAHFRDDVALTKDLNWKSLTSAIYLYDDYTAIDSYRKEKGSTGLAKLFKSTPKLKKVLPKLRAQPNNGEHALLSWYNRAR
ncbi:MAG: hypothetical protein RBR82_15540 [Pseudomonas sp.]|nr:hypothetical protein [Pseudomonas sp.]